MKENFYYSEKQDGLASNPHTYDFCFREHKFRFKTDAGVFSKAYIDFGSFTMLEAFTPNTIDAPILDMGCGYGPIGIVVSTLYDREVLMVDINERAISLTNDNIKTNKVDKAKAQKSYIYDSIPDEMMFSSIITNPPIRAGKKVVFDIYDGAYNHLLPGGELWVVIQKKQGAPSSMKHLEELFSNCEVVCKNKGYFILKSRKCN
jgi:16S rRNA (guanine1207-N2)-methyltransferase